MSRHPYRSSYRPPYRPPVTKLYPPSTDSGLLERGLSGRDVGVEHGEPAPRPQGAEPLDARLGGLREHAVKPAPAFVHGGVGEPEVEEVGGEPFIVPLAIPYVAGPSLLAVELLLMSREPHRWAEWLAALTLAWLATAAVVLLVSRLSAYPGRRGLIALERLTGMILVAIAVQMFLSGAERYVAQLTAARG